MIDQSFKEKNIPPEEEGLIIIGKMASGIMHDVNNILTTIQGYTTLLMLNSKDNQTKQYIEIIQKCVSDGKEIVKRIRKLNIKTKYKVENVNVKEQIESVILMTKPIWHNDAIAMGKSITVIFNGDDSLYVNCNENELREALINIIINSADAIEKNGNIVIDLYKEDSMVVVEIIDTGCGIDQEIVEMVFEPFFTTKGERGNGLGLSMVRELIEKMNGTIHFKSAKGFGSSVIIKLPISEKKQREKIEPNSSRLEKELKVLVVDDQAEVGEVIKEMIIALGNIKASMTSSSGKAFEMMKTESYDLVITDMVMPEINGGELVKMAKKMYPNSKYVIMTGCIKDEKCIEDTGVDYILNKPLL
jgi:CheY-like chemotaxis protein